jgi:hypothetical protein
MAYLGYDPCSLGVLLGALEAVALERLASGDPPDPWSDGARQRHRRVVTSLTAFAEPMGAVLRGDPLGRFAPMHLDPSDLRWWSVSRGGHWRTVRDPTAPAGGPRLSPAVQNARAVAADLAATELDGLWGDRGRRAASLLAYLEALEADPLVARAFLEALGPAGFRRLLDEIAAMFDAGHQPFGPDPTRADLSLHLLDALGRLWAGGRAAGPLRSPPWDDAARSAGLTASTRLLAIASRAGGAMSSEDLAGWGHVLWVRLVRGMGTAAAPQPEVAATNVLVALGADGRAARRFLLDLADGPDRRPLLFLIANVLTSPDTTGAVLLASTDPSSVVTAADDRDVGRSMQAVLRTVADLLGRQEASFPVVLPDGSSEDAGSGRFVPSDLGIYVGRYLTRLVDPGDGARTGAPVADGPSWPGWHEREVAGVLRELVADPRTAAQLDDAALAAFVRDVGGRDLTASVTDPAVDAAAFAVAAVGAVRRDHAVERAEQDIGRFDRMVAGLDLAVAAVGEATTAAPAAADLAKAWSWGGHVAASGGLPTPGRLVLAPFSPRSVREELATARADEALRTAVLQRTVARAALGQLQAAGVVEDSGVPALPAPAQERISRQAERTRPGDNANAAALAELDDVERWLQRHRGSAAADTVEHLLDSVGAAAARGAAWVA